MKKLNFILIILIIFCARAFSQNVLRGTITETPGNRVLPQTNIYIPDLKTGGTAGVNGNYEITNLPPGTYMVEAHLLGHTTVAKLVTINGQTVLDFTLEISNIEGDEVVITGNSSGTDYQHTPVIVSEVPNSFLTQNASTNIIDALKNIPGVSGISGGQSFSKPVVRGLGYNRVVTINDGVRQEGQQWGDEFGIEVDPNSVNRIEILKGPGSLIYGSDAISGVINFIPENNVSIGDVKGEVMNNYQTNNGLVNSTFKIGGNQNGVAWSWRASSIMAHAYQNKYDGYVFNSQFSNWASDGTIGLHRSWGFSQLHYSSFDFRTGIVEGARDSATGKFVKQVLTESGEPADAIASQQDLLSYTPYVINQIVKHNKIVWDNSLALGNSRMIGRFAWQQNNRREFNDITIADTSNIWYFLNTYSYDLRFVSPDKNKFNYTIGANGMSQNSENKGTLLLIPEYKSFDLGLFAIANKSFNKIDLSAGVRYDSRMFEGMDEYIDSSGNHLTDSDPDAIHRFTAYHSNFSGLSGSVGMAFQLNESFYLKLNAAKGFRAPNVAESGSNGIHDGTVVYEIGDPTLHPESSLQFDVALGVDTKNITAELDLFANMVSNYIYPKHLFTATGADSVNSSTPGFEGAPVFKYTQGNAMLTGGEFSVDIHPSTASWFDLNLGYSMVNAELKNTPDSAKYLPFTPPAKLNADITFNIFKNCNSFSNTYFRVGVNQVFSQQHVYHATQIYYALPAEEALASITPSDAYMLFSAGVGTDIMSGDNKLFSVYVSADNLTNVGYMDYMSRFKYYPVNFSTNPVRVGVFNMGRNISFKLIVPIDGGKK